MLEFTYRCIECGAKFEITLERMVCPHCSKKQKKDEPLRGLLEVVTEGHVSPDWDVWDLMPVPQLWFPSIPVGNTPLWAPSILREATGFPRLFIKDEGANPTGSLKDRASILVAAFALQHGADEIAAASTGNAGSSIAGIGAAAGLDIKLFLPESAPQAKLTQALQYGAEVVRVKGNYDQAFDACLEYSLDSGCLCRNTAYNPLTIEGKKSASIELFRQLGHQVPDYVFVSAGDGVILSGLYRGFEDLLSLGLSPKIPSIIAVQAEGSAAIKNAYDQGAANSFEAFDPEYRSQSVADSIQVDIPRGGYFALNRLFRHGGKVMTVSDDEILKAQYKLSSSVGLFSEPAGAAAAAGFFKLRKELSPQSKIVIFSTGNGLKDIESAKTGVAAYGS